MKIYNFFERIQNLQNLWIPNYNPWHDPYNGQFTFAGQGFAVWPSSLIGFSTSALYKAGKKDVRIDYSKLPAYRPDKAAVSVSNAYQSGMSRVMNDMIREVRNAQSASDARKAFDTLVKAPNKLARVPGESGNYYYTSTLIRNMSRTTAFKNDEEITLYQGISGDQYNKRAMKGTKLQLNNFMSSSTSAVVGTDYAIRRGTQAKSSVQTVYAIKCPPGTAMAIPTYTKMSGGLNSNTGMSDESEVVLPPSTFFQITKVGNMKTVKDANGNAHKVRVIELTVIPREKSAEQLSQGDYSRYEEK